MAAGCHGMVYATVSHKLTQLMPFNPDEAVAADNETVRGSFYWEVTDPEPELTLRAWSPGTSYDHTITVRVTMLPKEVATFMPLIDLLTRFLTRIGVIR